MNHTGYITVPEDPRRPLTARNLEDFALCRQKYLLSFFATPAQERRFIGGPAALHRALRAALVAMCQTGGPQQVSEAPLLQLFEQNWEGELCADSREEEQLHAEGLSMLQAYHQAHSHEPNRTIASDMRFTGEVGGYQLVAVADCVDQAGDGGVTLLRYRSSRRTPSPAELAEDLSAGLLLILGQAHFPEAVCRTAVYALRQGRLVTAAVGKQIVALRQRITDAAQTVRHAQEFPTNVGTHCRWCRAQVRCPAWSAGHYQPQEES